MFLTRLFSRRRVSPTPGEVALKTGQGEEARRLEACRRLSSLTELSDLAAKDPDAGVRELAQARYRHLLCGLESPPLPLDLRLAEISRIEDQRLLAHLASEGKEVELRLTAIQRLTDQASLTTRALADPATQVRLAAAERLTERQALEQVARQIGKKDKRVHRLVHGRLRELAEQEARPARLGALCEDLCTKLERLGRFENWTQDKALFDLLERQWREIADEAPLAWRERFDQERTRFLAAYADHQALQARSLATAQAQDKSQEEAEALITELTQVLGQSDGTLLRQAGQALMARWESLPFPATPDQTRRYQATHATLVSRLALMASEQQALDHLSAWLTEARAALDRSESLNHERLSDLLAAIPSPPPLAGPDQSLLAAVEEARQQLQERQRRQRRHVEQRLTQAQDRLLALEAALEAGELKRAEPLFQSLQAALEAASATGLDRERTAKLKGRLQTLGPRLRELQQWRRWGADTHREGLCQAMEALATTDIPPAARADRLQELRAEWKTLDQEGSPVNHPLWDRFHAAGEIVHGLCKPYLEERAREREAARQAREDLCAQLEDFLARVDWTRVDWRQAQRAERAMREGWDTLGEVEARHHRGLERRFRTALKQLDDRLAAEREANQALKRQLIAQVEALLEAPDLNRAIEETKRLQAQWRTTVAARQRDENRLWQQFRTACDGVFARRRQRFEAQTAELEEHLRLRQAILAEAEALAEATSAQTLSPTSEPTPAPGAGVSSAPNSAPISAPNSAPNSAEASSGPDPLPALEARWREAAQLPVPRQAAAELDRRWRRALELIQAGRRAQVAARRRERLDRLARQARICAELEQALELGQDLGQARAKAEEQWQALAPAPEDRLSQGMAARYHRAQEAAAAGKDLPMERTQQGQERAELCLRLEILAQIPSPPAYAAERLAYQVNLLREHLGTGERDPQADLARQVEAWYLIGPVPAAVAAAQEARFQGVLAALEGGERAPAMGPSQ